MKQKSFFFRGGTVTKVTFSSAHSILFKLIIPARTDQSFIPEVFKISSNGQNLVKADCSKLTPTNTPSQSQLILTV